MSRSAWVEYIGGPVSVLVSALVWYTLPFYSWLPLALFVGLIAAVTGLLAPRHGWKWVALQLLIGAAAASLQIGPGNWLDLYASPPPGAARPLSESAKLLFVNAAAQVVCAMAVFAGTRLIRRWGRA